MYHPIKQRVGQRWIRQKAVPMFCWELAGYQQRTRSHPAVDNIKQDLRRSERYLAQSEIVDYQ